MRLLCIKGHDVINLQIKSIKWFISENLSCKKKSCQKKGRIHIKLPPLQGKKVTAKIKNVEEYILMFMCKKTPKIHCQQFQLYRHDPP